MSLIFVDVTFVVDVSSSVLTAELSSFLRLSIIVPSIFPSSLLFLQMRFLAFLLSSVPPFLSVTDSKIFFKALFVS